MKLFLIVLIGTFVAVSANEAWKSFKLKHNKTYETAEKELARMKVFMENAKKIAKHNERFKNGEVTDEKGINEYSDMSEEEFNSIMNGFEDKDDEDSKDKVYHEVPEGAEIPESFDWRDKGAVTSVKNQKHCGSCWTFGSLGSVEGAYFLKYGKLKSFSEQNILDCVKPDHQGCYGGNHGMAFDYVKKHHGVSTYREYPYKGTKGQCKNKPKDKKAMVKSYVNIRSGDEKALKHAIATIGPITVSIDAKHSLKDHKRGTYYHPECTTKTNHCILAVGYGKDEKGEYYIIKNSWGPTWGEDGYFKLARDRDNNCGIATDGIAKKPAYPKL